MLGLLTKKAVAVDLTLSDQDEITDLQTLAQHTAGRLVDTLVAIVMPQEAGDAEYAAVMAKVQDKATEFDAVQGAAGGLEKLRREFTA